MQIFIESLFILIQTSNNLDRQQRRDKQIVVHTYGKILLK